MHFAMQWLSIEKPSSSGMFLSLLRRDINKAFAQVTNDKINRGAGYGLEVLCRFSSSGWVTVDGRVEINYR